MLNTLAALQAAQVPGYRAAFRSAPGQKDPPDLYCVYTHTFSPQWAQDDGDTFTRIRAFLHLYARGDPTSADQAVAAAMRGQGYSLVRRTEGYDHTADLYEILTEWEGLKHGI